MSWLRRAMRWLFGAPFQELPPAFGATVPLELPAYEEEVNKMAHHPVGTVSPPKRNVKKRQAHPLGRG